MSVLIFGVWIPLKKWFVIRGLKLVFLKFWELTSSKSVLNGQLTEEKNCNVTINFMGGHCNFLNIKGASVLNLNLRGGQGNFVSYTGSIHRQDGLVLKTLGWRLGLENS